MPVKSNVEEKHSNCWNAGRKYCQGERILTAEMQVLKNQGGTILPAEMRVKNNFKGEAF